MTRTPEVVVAMDWGGTWARGGVIDRDGEILWSSRLPNVTGGSQEQLLADAESVLRQAIDWCGNRQIAGIGVGDAPSAISTNFATQPTTASTTDLPYRGLV